jgi:hypothetical protein
MTMHTYIYIEPFFALLSLASKRSAIIRLLLTALELRMAVGKPATELTDGLLQHI